MTSQSGLTQKETSTNIRRRQKQMIDSEGYTNTIGICFSPISTNLMSNIKSDFICHSILFDKTGTYPILIMERKDKQLSFSSVNGPKKEEFIFFKLNEKMNQIDWKIEFESKSYSSFFRIQTHRDNSLIVYGQNLHGDRQISLIDIDTNEIITKTISYTTRFEEIIQSKEDFVNFLYQEKNGKIFAIKRNALTSARKLVLLQKNETNNSAFLQEHEIMNMLLFESYPKEGRNEAFLCEYDDKIAFAFDSKVILYTLSNDLKRFYKFDLEKNNFICHIEKFQEFLCTIFTNGDIFLFDKNLKVMNQSKVEFETSFCIESVYLRSPNLSTDTYSFYFVYNNMLMYDKHEKKIQNLEMVTYENNMINEIMRESKGDSFKENIITNINFLKKCQKALQSEIDYSENFLKKISNSKENTDNDILFLGLQDALCKYGTELIVKNTNENDETVKIHSNFLFKGILTSCPFTFSLELMSNDANMRFLDLKRSPKVFKEFCAKFTRFISRQTKVPADEVVILDIHNTNVTTRFTFSNSFAHNNYLKNEPFTKMVNNQSFDEDFGGITIKNYRKLALFEECHVSENMLNPKYNRTYNYNFKDDRGTLPYYPPLNWTRYGMNIAYFGFKDEDDWIQMNKNPNEWAVAYHGLRHDPIKTVDLIMNQSHGKLKTGSGNVWESSTNINKLDIEGFGKPCGKGVYCSPNIEIADSYSTEVQYDNNTKKAKIAFMCRVNPKELKIPQDSNNFYIVTSSENIRPYGFLVNKIE